MKYHGNKTADLSTSTFFSHSQPGANIISVSGKTCIFSAILSVLTEIKSNLCSLKTGAKMQIFPQCDCIQDWHENQN